METSNLQEIVGDSIITLQEARDLQKLSPEDLKDMESNLKNAIGNVVINIAGVEKTIKNIVMNNDDIETLIKSKDIAGISTLQLFLTSNNLSVNITGNYDLPTQKAVDDYRNIGKTRFADSQNQV